MHPPRLRAANSARKAAFPIAVAALLALAGCSGDAADAGPPALTISTDGQTGAKPPGQNSAAVAPDAAAREKRLDSDPKRLIGLDHGALTTLLGDPVFRRKDAPAELWRYRGDGCMLDLFLYAADKAAAVKTGPLVRHVEARGLSDGTVSPDDCLRGLLSARGTRQAT